MFTATAAPSRPVQFDAADADRFTESLDWLVEQRSTAPRQPSVARTMTENVRALASAIARYDTHDADGQGQLRSSYPDLDKLDEARTGARHGLRPAGRYRTPKRCGRDPVHRSVAAAVVAETKARVVPTSDPERRWRSACWRRALR